MVFGALSIIFETLKSRRNKAHEFGSKQQGNFHEIRPFGQLDGGKHRVVGHAGIQTPADEFKGIAHRDGDNDLNGFRQERASCSSLKQEPKKPLLSAQRAACMV